MVSSNSVGVGVHCIPFDRIKVETNGLKAGLPLQQSTQNVIGQIVQRLGETSMGRNVQWAKRLETL